MGQAPETQRGDDLPSAEPSPNQGMSPGPGLATSVRGCWLVRPGPGQASGTHGPAGPATMFFLGSRRPDIGSPLLC